MVISEPRPHALHSRVIVETFNRSNLYVFTIYSKGDTGSLRGAIDKNGTSPAHPLIAPNVGPCQAELFPDDIRQYIARRNTRDTLLTVHLQCNRTSFLVRYI
ncbi:hypothetical protein D9M71_477660 [compost metagenome]